VTRHLVNHAPRRAMVEPSPPTSRGPGRRLAIVLALATALAGIAVPVFMTPARAVTTTITVNSTAYGGPAANPSSGVCETAVGNGNCTLRAAIEVSNALNRPAGEVLINVANTILPNTKMTGSMNTSSNFMSTTSMNRQDANGAQYYVTALVIIDLGHRLQPDSSSDDTGENAMFYITGSDVQILNVDNALGAGSSFVIGGTARNVTINGDTMGTNGGFGTMYASSWGPERFVVVMQGAQNVYVANYKITGYYDSNSDGGIFVFANPNTTAPTNITQNIVFENIQVTNQNTGNCDGNSATGCNTRVLNFWQGSSSGTVSTSYVDNVINGLTFRGVVINFLSQAMYGFQFANPTTSTTGTSSSDITNLTIENCRFLRITPTSNSQQDAFINLPYSGYLHGTNVIRNNVFTTPTTTAQGGTATAIYFLGPQAAGSTTPSNLSITGNYFNGHGGAGTIRTKGVGLVTISGNTFGAATKSAANANEETADTNVMYSFAGATSPYASTNQAIVTWAPTTGSATMVGGPAPAGSVAVQPPSAGVPSCQASLTVTKPTSAATNYTIPADPVTLDVYWTGVQTAEVYLGSATGLTGPNATLIVPLPVGAVSLPDGTSVTPVNATTGTPSGFLRVQTQVQNPSQLESSQYSRAIPIVGTCAPTLTLNQAAGMADPTVARDLHFTLVSTATLDLATVTLDTVVVKATAVPQTIDPGRLNPRVVALTSVPGSGDTQFDVVVRVDDSAQVTVTVPAGAVAGVSGLANPAAASSTDNTITFLNPIQVNPTSFTLVTGDPTGKTFTIALAAGAPLPEEDLAFSATLTQPSGTPQVSLSTLYPVLGAGQTSAPPVEATVAAGNVAANTPATVALTVATADANYNGLVVAPVTVYLFSTDPTIAITKSAYVNVANTSTPSQIIATSTPAPVDSRLLDGQAVCFVYTVSNTSHDDWATSLSNVTVTDSDTRLGAGGIIGVIASIPIGQSAQLAACTTLIPVDTTTGGGMEG